VSEPVVSHALPIAANDASVLSSTQENKR